MELPDFFMHAGLGWKKAVQEDVLSSAKILHWNGKGQWYENALDVLCS